MVPAPQPVKLECWQQTTVIILSPLLTVLTEVTFYGQVISLSHFLPLFRWVQVMCLSLQIRRAALATSDTSVESHYQETPALEKGLYDETDQQTQNQCI